MDIKQIYLNIQELNNQLNLMSEELRELTNGKISVCTSTVNLQLFQEEGTTLEDVKQLADKDSVVHWHTYDDGAIAYKLTINNTPCTIIMKGELL